MSDPFVTFLQIMSAIAFIGFLAGVIYYGYLTWTGQVRSGPPQVPDLPPMTAIDELRRASLKKE
jgi:hypothetical protein